ncbi:MAG: PHP domain-containing protein, partial [Bacteroidetes bacterium]|nr:PHP domain-containing protein [Bacteroidota bacterium]
MSVPATSDQQQFSRTPEHIAHKHQNTVYLNCHSYYSLRYGTLSIDALIEYALNYNLQSLTLTDINNSMGIPDFVKKCREHGIKPLAGIEFRDTENQLLYIGIAKNNDGFRELNAFLSKYNLAKRKLPQIAPEFNHVFIIYPFSSRKNPKLRDHEFIGIRPKEIKKLISSPFSHNQDKLLALHPVTLAHESGYELHANLRAIDNNVLLSQLSPGQLADADEFMLPLGKLLGYYENYPRIIQNTLKISQECSVSFDFREHKNKKLFTGNRDDDRILLQKLALDGL